MEMLQAKKYPWKSSSKDVPASWKVWTASLFYSSSFTSKVSVNLLKGWWFPPAILPTCPLVTPIPCCGPFSALYILQGAKYIFTFLRSSVIINCPFVHFGQMPKLYAGNSVVWKPVTLSGSADILCLCPVYKWVMSSVLGCFSELVHLRVNVVSELSYTVTSVMLTALCT